MTKFIKTHTIQDIEDAEKVLHRALCRLVEDGKPEEYVQALACGRLFAVYESVRGLLSHVNTIVTKE